MSSYPPPYEYWNDPNSLDAELERERRLREVELGGGNPEDPWSNQGRILQNVPSINQRAPLQELPVRPFRQEPPDIEDKTKPYIEDAASAIRDAALSTPDVLSRVQHQVKDVVDTASNYYAGQRIPTLEHPAEIGDIFGPGTELRNRALRGDVTPSEELAGGSVEDILGSKGVNPYVSKFAGGVARSVTGLGTDPVSLGLMVGGVGGGNPLLRQGFKGVMAHNVGEDIGAGIESYQRQGISPELAGIAGKGAVDYGMFAGPELYDAFRSGGRFNPEHATGEVVPESGPARLNEPQQGGQYNVNPQDIIDAEFRAVEDHPYGRFSANEVGAAGDVERVKRELGATKEAPVTQVPLADKQAELLNGRENPFGLTPVPQFSKGVQVPENHPSLVGPESVVPPLSQEEDIIKPSKMEAEGGKLGVGFSPKFIKTVTDNLYSGNIGKIATKEAIQNAVDSLRGVPGSEKNGQIDVGVDTKSNEILARDNGTGMSPDIAKTSFLDIGDSVKPGGASGGFGIGIKSALANSHEFTLDTTWTDPTTGKTYNTVIKGDSDKWLSGQIPAPIITEMPPGSETGTTVHFKLSKPIDEPSTQEYLANFKDTHKLPYKTNLILNNKELKGVRHLLPEHFNTTPLTELHLPGSDVSIEGSKKYEKNNYIDYQVLNHGLPQFGGYVRLENEVPVPSRVVIDIKSHEGPESDNYPFKPDREHLKPEVESAISNYFKNELEQTHLRNESESLKNAILNAPKIAGSIKGRSVIDSSSDKRFTSLTDSISKDKNWGKFADAIEPVFDRLKERLSKWNPAYSGAKFHGFGLGYSGGHDYLGINIPAGKFLPNEVGPETKWILKQEDGLTYDKYNSRESAEAAWNKIIKRGAEGVAEFENAGSWKVEPESNASVKNIILLNPPAILEEVLNDLDSGIITREDIPRDLSRHIVATIGHEILHEVQRGHEEKFTGDQTRIQARILDEIVSSSNELEQFFVENPSALLAIDRTTSEYSQLKSTSGGAGEDIFGKIASHAKGRSKSGAGKAGTSASNAEGIKSGETLAPSSEGLGKDEVIGRAKSDVVSGGSGGEVSKEPVSPDEIQAIAKALREKGKTDEQIRAVIESEFSAAPEDLTAHIPERVVPKAEPKKSDKVIGYTVELSNGKAIRNVIADTPEAAIQKIRDLHAKSPILPEGVEPVQAVTADQYKMRKESGLTTASKGGKGGGGSKPPEPPNKSEDPIPGEESVDPESKPGSKLLQIWQEANAFSRALKTAFDVSFIGRQGLFQSIAHPSAGLKTLTNTFKGFSTKQFDKIDSAIKDMPTYELSQEAGLYHADPKKVEGKEEFFQSKFAGKIPGVQTSERAFTAAANTLRSAVFEILSKPHLKLGKDFESDPELFKGIARYINVSTGRGDIKWLTQSKFFNAVLYSPKFSSSRLQMLGADPTFYYKLPREMKWQAAKDWAKYATFIMAVQGLASLAGMKTEDDPTSPNFGKVSLGKTHVDFSAGMQPFMRVIAETVLGRKKSTSGKRYSTSDVRQPGVGKLNLPGEVGNFLRQRLAPIPSTVLNTAFRQNAIGQPTSIRSEAENLFAPMAPADIYDSAKIPGGHPELAIPSALFGLGTQTYDPNAFKRGKKSVGPYRGNVVPR